MINRINTVDELVEYLYNTGVGDSLEELKKSTFGLTDLKLAMMSIFNNVKMSPQKVKDVISLTGEKNAKSATEDFFAFYCSYIDHSYITQMYRLLTEKDFEHFITKLNNIPTILSHLDIDKNSYIYTMLIDKMREEVAKINIIKAAREENNKKQG